MTSRLPALIFGGLVLFAIGLAAAGFNPREYAEETWRHDAAFRRHRQHRRRLLPVRRRTGARDQPVGPERRRHRRGHQRLGRQPQAHSAREGRHRIRAHRHAGRRDWRARAVREGPGQGTYPCGALSQLHARGDDRREEHRAARRSARAGRVDRLAGQRHRSDCLPSAARRGTRSRQGHPQAESQRERVGRRHQGRQDRRVLLERRLAHGVAARSRQHGRCHAEADPE